MNRVTTAFVQYMLTEVKYYVLFFFTETLTKTYGLSVNSQSFNFKHKTLTILFQDNEESMRNTTTIYNKYWLWLACWLACLEWCESSGSSKSSSDWISDSAELSKPVSNSGSSPAISTHMQTNQPTRGYVQCYQMVTNLLLSVLASWKWAKNKFFFKSYNWV